MPLYVERAQADYLTGAEIVEQLGAWIGGTYNAAETQLLEEIARRLRRDLRVDDVARRLDTIRELRDAAARVFDAIDTDDMARRIVQTAILEGEAAAIEQLGFTESARRGTAIATGPNGALPFATGITPGSATAAAQIGLELTSALADVRERILRAVPDIYQRIIAQTASERVLGVVTRRTTQTRSIAAFLARGIPAFRDRAGRDWSIGAYTEMAGRTATNRAWLAAHEQRWSSMGLHLVTIVRGLDSCQSCAAWSGKILSTDGRRGVVETEHAVTGAPVTLVIAGTLADARAGGWNHPNCRCTLTPVFPGLSLPANESTYDPQKERDRDRLRSLERRVRAAKRQAAVAEALGDDVAAAYYRAQVRDLQAEIRGHVASTGQSRKPYREALSWSGTVPSAPAPLAVSR